MSATMDVEDLAVFAAVVRAESFTGAARALRTHKAHVSRVVGRLERALGVRLLHRSSRSIALTEAGRELHDRGAAILTALEEARSAVQGTQRAPHGVLRLSCGVELGLIALHRWIARFLGRYPRVSVEAHLGDRPVELIREGYDLAIRVGTLPDSALSARRLGEIRYALYASPAYLRGRRAPERPDDLAGHDLIAFYAGRAPRWTLTNGRERAELALSTARLVVNSHLVARDAVDDGLGVGLLPRFQAAALVEVGRLVEVLPGWTREPAPIHALFARSSFLAPKLRVFLDLASEHPLEL